MRIKKKRQKESKGGMVLKTRFLLGRRAVVDLVVFQIPEMEREEELTSGSSYQQSLQVKKSSIAAKSAKETVEVA